jgi:magnesium-transporting ATPase (P-type)
MLPALGLGAESPDSRVMQHPPRSREDRLLTPGLLLRAYLFLGPLEAAAAMSAFFFVLAAAGRHADRVLSVGDTLYRQATTACLTAIVFMQVVNVHLCRSRRTSIVSRPFFDNSLITAGIVAELGLILLIVYTAPGHAVFGTAPLGYEAWLFVIPFATAMLLLEEVRKAFVRRRERASPSVFERTSGLENNPETR